MHHPSSVPLLTPFNAVFATSAFFFFMVFFATVGLVFCIAFMAEVRVGKMAGSVDKIAWPHVWLVSQLQIV